METNLLYPLANHKINRLNDKYGAILRKSEYCIGNLLAIVDSESISF